MFVGTKVGEFSISQRHKLSSSVEIEEIFEGEIYKEHQLTQKAQEEINASFKNFGEKYGIKTGEVLGKKRPQKSQGGTTVEETEMFSRLAK